MLFNSYAFLFAFLPIALAGYFLLGRRSITLAAGWRWPRCSSTAGGTRAICRC